VIELCNEYRRCQGKCIGVKVSVFLAKCSEVKVKVNRNKSSKVKYRYPKKQLKYSNEVFLLRYYTTLVLRYVSLFSTRMTDNGPHSRTFSEVSSEMFLTGFGKTT